MDKLSKLAQKYGADKFGKHNYTPFYHNLFKDRRKTVKKVVEMGAGEGASLRMWRDFFPNAIIYSGEIDDDRVFEENRIEVIKCDQSSPQDLVQLIGRVGRGIDLFVDDGSHRPEDQVLTCKVLMPLFDTNVTYVIEDVADVSIVDQLDRYHLEIKKFSSRYDDRVVIVKHNI